ncbi:LCP family protein [Brachybacterium nesterenkovii]|uniref:LCP family protein n=1 Tax=Brachybacterium nesterenkovii TaxID=47847 RepID=UPI00321BB445
MPPAQPSAPRDQGSPGADRSVGADRVREGRSTAPGSGCGSDTPTTAMRTPSPTRVDMRAVPAEPAEQGGFRTASRPQDPPGGSAEAPRGAAARARAGAEAPRGDAARARAGSRRAGSASPLAARLSRIPRPLRLLAFALALVLVVSGAWFSGLALWANGRIEHVDALSDMQGTPGTTYLIAGSDRRGGETVADDGTEGERADTMMLLHKAPNGNSYLVSLPRDTLVDIPGHGKYKLNAAYAFGGPALLVETVEDFTGMKVDHFVEIGFDGVSGLVDAVGTVNLCIDQDVDDEKSGLKMTKGCHDTGGEQALAFVRARYFDPTADIGRQQRQQQFVSALMKRVMTPVVLLNPLAQVRLADAGTAALRTDDSTGVIDLARMVLTMRTAMNDGTTLTMPINDPNYHTKKSGVAILTDEDDIKAFFGSIEDGSAKAPAQG